MISERLRTLRREKNISKRELVSKLPLNYSTYANYESGFREPNSEVLQMLAKHFGVSIDYLLGVSDNRKTADEVAVLTDDEHEHIIQYRQLDTHGRTLVNIVLQKECERVNFINPLYQGRSDDQWVRLPVYQQKMAARLDSYLGEEGDAAYELMRFVLTPVSQKADFCILIQGDSMEPKICDEDIVFVKSMPKIDPDNVGIFVYDGESYCKRLRVDSLKERIFLESINRSFAPKEITQPENLRTIGLVIGIAERPSYAGSDSE